jgi:hypothetical protein
LSVATADDAVRFAVGFSVPQETSEQVGMSWTLPFDGSIPKNQVAGTLVVQLGSALTVEDCNDAVDPANRPVVTQQWSPVAGFATLTVDELRGEAWEGGPMTFDGTISLRGVVVERSGRAGTTCALPDASWSDLSLGWLPG